MSDELQLPRAAGVFVSFAALLRANGFLIAPEQTTAFLAAIDLLGPRSLEHIRRAGLATLAPPPERRATYDRLFDLHFRGSEAIERADEARTRKPSGCRRKAAATRSPCWPMKPMNPASPRRARKRWSSAALRGAQPAMRCGVCPAKPPPDCRGGAAIAAGAHGAAPSPTCAVRCATACAMTARYCDWAACDGARGREKSCC